MSQKISQLNKEIYEAKQDSTKQLQTDSQKVLYTRESTNPTAHLCRFQQHKIDDRTAQLIHKNRIPTSNDALIKPTQKTPKSIFLSKYHNELLNLKIRVEKLKQDSINLTTQLQNNQALASIELKHDSLIAIINRQVQIASNRFHRQRPKEMVF